MNVIYKTSLKNELDVKTHLFNLPENTKSQKHKEKVIGDL